jgi:hypothetical protein
MLQTYSVRKGKVKFFSPKQKFKYISKKIKNMESFEKLYEVSGIKEEDQSGYEDELDG